MKTVYLSLATILLAGSFFMGCSDNKEEGTGRDADILTLSGDFGTAYAYYQAPWYKRLVTPLQAGSSYDSIINSIAIPIASDRIMMDEAIPLDIESDGKFVADITKDYGWIVLLEKENGLYSFLSIPMSVDSNDSLITFFPKSDIDFGKVEYKSIYDEADSEENISDIGDKFIFSLEELKDIAVSDDAYKAVANSYRNNYNKEFDEQVNEEISLVSVSDKPLNTTEFVRADDYQGFALSFYYGEKTVLASAGEKICNNAAQVGMKFPDSSFTLYSADHNYTGALMSHDMSFDSAYDTSVNACTMVDDNFVISYGQGTLSFFRGESTSMLAQNSKLISGLFTLQVTEDGVSQKAGEFELDYNLPVTRHGDLLLPVPAFKMHLNESGMADYCDVKWYLYDQRSHAYKVIDFKPYQSILRDIEAGAGTYAASFNDKFDRIDFTDVDTVWEDKNNFGLGVQYNVANTYVRFQAVNWEILN